MYKEIFNNYTSSFDLSNNKIALKYNHSFRVRDLAVKYAKELNYSEDDIKLAEFIGLYHDLGRFNQLKNYNTFIDSKSINHAMESVRVLFEEGLINNFDFTEEEKEIIKFAIGNHNKLLIEECDDERKLMHAKLIRDVDKLDIIYMYGYLNDGEDVLIVYPNEVDQTTIQAFKKHELIPYQDTPNFEVYKMYGFAYEINNDVVVEKFKTYLTAFNDRYNDHKQFDELFNETISFLERRI